MKHTKQSIISKDGISYLIPFILITSCFALWGFANDITNPMVKAFSKIFRMSATDGALVQVAFYGGYFAMAFPAAIFIRKYSYKAGVLLGLGMYAFGAFLFFPAKMTGEYYPFLIAYFILTCGLSFQYRYNRLPNICVADSGYGSEENYRFMQENGIEAFIKYNYFHKEQRPRYTPNPFHAESLHYNAQEDYYVCPMGQHMNRIGTKRDKTASGYITESARYKAKRCEGCPLRGSCFKARGNRIIEVNHRLNQYKRQARERLLSEEGIKHRGRRCIEPEAVFGQIKYNMAYRRFRHVGEDKVTMDFAFFAIAFNIKKMCAKLIKEGKGLITVAKYMFMGLFITRYNWNIATCCQMHEEKAA
jgi:hypothetical protein